LDGQLKACEFDAKDMQTIATKNGFESNLLLTQEATATNVAEAIRDAAKQLKGGDIFFISNSSHGGQVPDTNGDEEDGKDETWCLFDRQLIDDELYALWSQFAPGVRILVLSDSCHSGSAARGTLETIGIETLTAAVDEAVTNEPRLKVLPEPLQREVYEQHKQLYDDIEARTTAHDKTEIPVQVLLISGCQDSQTSSDGDRNGLFTQTLRSVWDDGAFNGSYRSLWKKIVKAMPLWQAPNFYWAGEPSATFERQRPFSV
jgi:metacaspase-1